MFFKKREEQKISDFDEVSVGYSQYQNIVYCLEDTDST